MAWLTERLEEVRRTVEQLLSQPAMTFDESLRSKLPEKSGLYVISSLKTLQKQRAQPPPRCRTRPPLRSIPITMTLSCQF